MRTGRFILSLALLTAAAGVQASPLVDNAEAGSGPDHLECVPFARQVSGIQIYGDAHTWWGQASGRYKRGSRPRVGAVMAFRPHRNSRLGHVAAVSRIVDSRTVLISHANWSPIDGRRGQVERDVTAIDVSPANDWSEVRVWYDPAQSLGTTHWPLYGFIYNDRTDAPQAAGEQRLSRIKDDPVGAIIAGTYR